MGISIVNNTEKFCPVGDVGRKEQKLVIIQTIDWTVYDQHTAVIEMQLLLVTYISNT